MIINKNLANYLTVLRILVIPIIVFSFYLENFSPQVGAILFIFASITDFFDGYFARKLNIVSSLGFDPIAGC